MLRLSLLIQLTPPHRRSLRAPRTRSLLRRQWHRIRGTHSGIVQGRVHGEARRAIPRLLVVQQRRGKYRLWVGMVRSRVMRWSRIFVSSLWGLCLRSHGAGGGRGIGNRESWGGIYYGQYWRWCLWWGLQCMVLYIWGFMSLLRLRCCSMCWRCWRR